MSQYLNFLTAPAIPVSIPPQAPPDAAVTTSRHNATAAKKPTMSKVTPIPQEQLVPLFNAVYHLKGTEITLPATDKGYFSMLRTAASNSVLHETPLTEVHVSDSHFYSVPVAFEALLYRGIILIPTNLTGKGTPEFYADFVFSIDGKTLISCPGGHTPCSCSYSETNKTCTATFEASQCEHCPHFKECHPQKVKAGYIKRISQITKARAVLEVFFQSEEFKIVTRFRNGIEAAPSALRRRSNVDHMQARGKPRVRIFFGFRVAALNFVKFLKGLQRKESGKRRSLDDYRPKCIQEC